MKTDKKIIATYCFGAILLFAGGLVYDVISTGFVAMKLWSWFIVPTFGVDPLTLTQSWGLASIVAFATNKYQFQANKDERTEFEKWTQNIVFILRPWIILTFVFFTKLLIFPLFE